MLHAVVIGLQKHTKSRGRERAIFGAAAAKRLHQLPGVHLQVFAPRQASHVSRAMSNGLVLSVSLGRHGRRWGVLTPATDMREMLMRHFQTYDTRLVQKDAVEPVRVLHDMHHSA